MLYVQVSCRFGSCSLLFCFIAAALSFGGERARPPRGYSIPVIDLAHERYRQVVVDREPGQLM